MLPDRSGQLPTTKLGEEVRHAPRDDDSRVGRVVHQVVRHTILTTLPNEDAGRVPVDLPRVVDVVVVNRIVLVDVLRSRPVATKQDAATTHVLNVVARDSVSLPVQVDTDRAASAMQEVAILDRAVLGATQANQRIRLIQKIPVVL